MTSTTADVLVVGSGLTGAVIARHLHDAGVRVLVIDRRSHLGGNVHDHLHRESGLRVHTYGPHYFRTNNANIWAFVNRFGSFYDFSAVLASFVDGRHEAWPVTEEYIRRTVGEKWTPGFDGEPTNFEEASLSMMPPQVYEKFVKGYTEKQWGVEARSLSADLAGRFDVRSGDDLRLKNHRHQGIPVGGYTAWMTALLDGIPLELDVDFLSSRDRRGADHVVFTGPIDEYFEFDLGRLAYRGQRREHSYRPGVVPHQPFVQVNNPDPGSGDHIRTLDWSHCADEDERRLARGTVITREIPYTPSDPHDYEYPFPDERNRLLLDRYRRRAAEDRSVTICGRLGEYRYYDMDQAIGRAMAIVRKMLA